MSSPNFVPSSNTSFTDAVSLQWAKMAKKEFQVKMDILKTLFSRTPLKDKAFTHRVVDKVASTRVSITAANSRPNTPAGQNPKWRRRISKPLISHIRINAERAQGKELGLNVDELAALYIELYLMDRQRDSLLMSLEFIQANYQENIAVYNNNGANTEKGFPAASSFMPKKLAASDEVPMTVNQWFAIRAIYNNKLGINSRDNTMTPNSIKNVKNVYITSELAWADFLTRNKAEIGNYDFGGKKIVVNGDEYDTFHGTMIVKVNDPFLPVIAADDISREGVDAVINFGLPANLTKTINTAVAGEVAGNVSTTSLQRSYFLNPDAMDIKDVTQHDVKPTVVSEQTKSQEPYIYGRMSLEAQRIYDEAVFAIYHTIEGQKYDIL